MAKTTVYIADPIAIFREGIGVALAGDAEIEVIGSTSRNQEAERFVRAHSPQVVIMHCNGAAPSGLEVATSLRREVPGVKFVMILDREDDDAIWSAIRCGASAWINRDIGAAPLISLVKEIARGSMPAAEALLRPAIAARVLEEFKSLSLVDAEDRDIFAELTPAESNLLLRASRAMLPAQATGAAVTAPAEINLPHLLAKLLGNDLRRELLEKVGRARQIAAKRHAGRRAEEGPRDGEELIALRESVIKLLPAMHLEDSPKGREWLAHVRAELADSRPAKEPPKPVEKAPPPPAGPPPAGPAQAPVGPMAAPSDFAEFVPSGLWENAAVTRLIESLFRGKLPDIVPKVDMALPDGFTYPEADAVLGTTGRATREILESLAAEDVLVRRLFTRLLLTPEGSPQIVPQEHCPKCDSFDLTKGQYIEHYDCGYVGCEPDFLVGADYVCPGCKRKLKLMGTDYRKLGVCYRCNRCSEIATAPVMKFRSLRTGRILDAQEIQELRLSSYRFNPALDFQLNSKARLMEFLKLRGYRSEELAKVKGRSGVVHTLDILATRDDVIIKHTVAIGVFGAKASKTDVPVDEMLGFYARAMDAGIYSLIAIAITPFSEEAQAFAKTHAIKVLTPKDIAELVTSGGANGLPTTEKPKS
ncbi:MAG: response regulator [Chloroflexi bacterium]|nr:response regulator [Chloroflexota bacterium]